MVIDDKLNGFGVANSIICIEFTKAFYSAPGYDLLINYLEKYGSDHIQLALEDDIDKLVFDNSIRTRGREAHCCFSQDSDLKLMLLNMFINTSLGGKQNMPVNYRKI